MELQEKAGPKGLDFLQYLAPKSLTFSCNSTSPLRGKF